MINPWPHSPYQIGKVEKNVGEATWTEAWTVYLNGELKFSGPTYEAAKEFCLRDQRKLGGRTSGMRG